MTRRIAALIVLTCISGAGRAAAQSPTPSPAPTATPTPAAFSAHGHLNVSAVVQGTTFTGNVRLTIMQRGALTRLDVLSVETAPFPIPIGALTGVLDRDSNTLTVWYDAARTYHVQHLFARPSRSPAPSATPSPSPRPRGNETSPLANIDVLDVSMKLTGHTTTAGVPTTGVAFNMQVRKKGDTALTHLSASAQLADEFAIFPMMLDVSADPGASSQFGGAKLSYAVDDFTRGLPPAATFAVPAGYREASSLFAVVFARRPAASPSPRPRR